MKKSNPYDVWFDDLEHKFQDVKSLSEISDILEKQTSTFGFEFFSFGSKNAVPFNACDIIMLGTYPPEWLKRYQEQNYIKNDPVLAPKRIGQIVNWDAQIKSQNKNLFNEARDCGLCHGITISTTGANFALHGLSFARSAETITQSEYRSFNLRLRGLMSLVGEHLANQSCTEFDGVKLTKREKESLMWVAEGKSSADIARILNLGEDTINFHIKNAMKKLNTSSRSRAAAYAAACRLL